MAEEDAEDAAAQGASGGAVEVEAKPKKKGLAGKKLILILAPIVLLAGGAAGAFFTGALDGLLGKTEPAMADGARGEGEYAEEDRAEAVFFDLPEMLVNLNSDGRNQSFLKLSVSLELRGKADVKTMETVLPRVVDKFQVYLRELRIEDLSGSAGMQRLREELLLRVNSAVRRGTVKDVLFKEMLVQ